MEKDSEAPDPMTSTLPEKYSLPMSTPNGMDHDTGQNNTEIPETPGSTEAAVAAVAAAMEQEEAAQITVSDSGANAAEPPAKRRRGGRRVSNPDVSAEERRRIRVLKNRESAMRSLAKKAEYSAKLVALQKEAQEEHVTKRGGLQKLVHVAMELREALEKCPDAEMHHDICEELTACINKASEVAVPLPDEDLQPPSVEFSARAIEPDAAEKDVDLVRT